jgi:hypothetical protein
MTTLDVIKYILLIPYFLWFITYALVSGIIMFPYLLLEAATTDATLGDAYNEFVENIIFPRNPLYDSDVEFPEVTENKQPTKTDE